MVVQSLKKGVVARVQFLIGFAKVDDAKVILFLI